MMPTAWRMTEPMCASWNKFIFCEGSVNPGKSHKNAMNLLLISRKTMDAEFCIAAHPTA